MLPEGRQVGRVGDNAIESKAFYRRPQIAAGSRHVVNRVEPAVKLGEVYGSLIDVAAPGTLGTLRSQECRNARSRAQLQKGFARRFGEHGKETVGVGGDGRVDPIGCEILAGRRRAVGGEEERLHRIEDDAGLDGSPLRHRGYFR